MEPIYWIELLGGLRIRHGERLITRFRTQKAGALLAYLAYYPEQSHSRETLLELFWPEAPLEAARNSLSVTLSSLRHQLEPPGVSAGSVLIADRTIVRLNQAMVRTDVGEFKERLRSVEQATSEYEQTQRLSQALELYSGPLLPGYYDDWILEEARNLVALSLQTTRRLMLALTKSGQFALALDYARSAITFDPSREEGHRDLMRLLAATGQTAAALHHFHELKARLLQETGTLPSAPTCRLAEEIQSRSSATLAPVPAISEADDQQATPILPTSQPAKREESKQEGESRPASLTTLPTTRMPTATSLPIGTVTLLLMDTEDLSGQVATGKKRSKQSVGPDDRLLSVFHRHGGYLFKEAGSALRVVFQSAGEALSCAISCQRTLTEQNPGGLPVRIALHSGDTSSDSDHYQNAVLQHTARILQSAHGGQILSSETTASLLRYDCEPGIQLQDLGAFRLRDETEVEHLFQVNYPRMCRTEFPPLRALAGHTDRLPLMLTRFFGREVERRGIQELLQQPQTRLVTLTGPGGIGKTRLATEVARHLLEPFVGAVWFVPLADITDALLIPDVILEALRRPRSLQIPPQEQVIAELSQQPCLLVLDNLEQLVEEAAPVVKTLLERVPALKCLTTSRRPLELSGEYEFSVSPLRVPQSEGVLEQLRFYESVQLFVDRAQSVKPDFQLTQHNAATLAQLCQGLEGIPLALELAATWIRVMSVGQMLSQLDHRFNLLVSRRRNIDARHRTLRATIDWSYNLLSDNLKPFFARLSVFRGGWHLEAAEAVCEEPLALDYLAQLREGSLISTQDHGEKIRFRMLETLREYAQEQLLPEEQQRLSNRHAHYYLTLAETAKSSLYGKEQSVWLDRLEAEHDNLRAAIGWFDRENNSPDLNKAEEAGLRLTESLSSFWWIRGYLSEGRVYLKSALQKATEPTIARANALSAIANLAKIQGDLREASGLLAEAITIHREIGDRQGEATDLSLLGSIYIDEGDYVSAQTAMEQALDIHRELGNRQSEASDLGSLGFIAREQGNYATARVLLEQALAITQVFGTPMDTASLLGGLAYVVSSQGDYAAAYVLFEQELVVWREIGNRVGEAWTLGSLGLVARDREDYSQARDLLEQALTINREIGNRSGEAWNLDSLGDVTQELGDYNIALTLLEQALAINREVGSRIGQAWNRIRLGDIARKTGETHTARSLYREALAQMQEMGQKSAIIEVIEGWALLHIDEGQAESAARLYSAAQAARQALGKAPSPRERAAQQRHVAALQAAMGPQRFADAWSEGQSLTLEEATVAVQDK